MENVPATFAFLKEYRQLYKGVNPDAMMVGEVWSETSQIARYCDGTTLDFCFEFALATAIIDGVRTNQPARIVLQMQTILQSYSGSQYAPFLSTTIRIGCSASSWVTTAK